MPDHLQSSSELQRSFGLYDQEITIKNIQLGCLLGMLLMPAGFILDFFVEPDYVGRFFILRLLCSALIGVFWIFVRSETGRRHYRLLGVVLALIPAFFISLMIYETDKGAASPYYAGLNLVLLVVGFILHWTLAESAVAVSAVAAMYFLACVWSEPNFLDHVKNDEVYRGQLANNAYFLALTGIIVIVGSGYHYRLRFREYALLFEIDKNKKELEENHRKLKQLDEIKSRFFANISHELRTPLTLLLSPLEALMTHAKRAFNSDQQELLATMQANGMRLLKLINDLLDLVRLESGRMDVRREPTDVDALVGGLILSVKKVAEDKKIRLQSSVDPELGIIMADRDKWEKILLNLVFNAVKFTPARGAVTLAVEKEGEEIVLRVRDTGMGISKENLANVFSRFWQADTSAQRKYQGVGIGLALVKELVEVQGGRVGVESEVNKGTTFTIRLPYEAGTEAAPPEPSQQGSAVETEESSERWLAELYRRAELFPSITSVKESLKPVEMFARGGAAKILIADDEPDMLRFLKSQLSAHFQVIEAVDGNQAFEKACQFLPDIILLDMMMPEKDGLQVCRQLRTRTSTSRIPVVLLTARADEETKLQALAAGASDFLSKPFSGTELHVRLKNLVEGYEYQRKLARQNQILEATLQQLKETETQLVQSEKLASLGRMSAGIIHEINNPLNFAKTATHMLQKQAAKLPGKEEQEEFADMLKDISEGIDRVRTIVSDLRSFTHPNADAFEEVSVRQVFTSTLRFLSHEWKDQVEIAQKYDENATVWGNRHQLIQLMINLLQNSIDALKGKPWEADKPSIEITGTAKGMGYLLSIKDNGPGIAPENVGRIFDPFFTTKDVGEGTGLGLSICYRIMETHGGRISVNSKEGEFTEFLLEFAPKPERNE